MSYAEAIDHLYALSGELAPPAAGAPRRKFDLDHMRVLAAALGDPQMRFDSVLIAGTNGKGSTAATLASILSVAGTPTGLYTSPHLLRVNERVQISNGIAGSNTLTEIDDDTFARLYFQVDDAARGLVAEGRLPHPPSFFEVLTALAFLAFAGAGVGIAVLEVGMGGRLDATNIVDPLVSVITDISLDHTEWLGDTITEIAREKAGILRPGGTLITLPQHPEANAAIGQVAMAIGVTGINAAKYLPGRHAAGESGVQILGETIAINSPLPGEHQSRNIALAITAALYLHGEHKTKLEPEGIAGGVEQTHWPGRLERILLHGSPVLIDVAHNPAGAWTLRSYLSKSFEDGSLPAPRTLLFSALRDKSIREMAQILFPLFDSPEDRIVLASIANPRAALTDELAEIAGELDTPVTVCGSISEAMQMATSQPGSTIVAGSVYLAGEVKTWLSAIAPLQRSDA